MSSALDLWTLFGSAFVSATIAPGGSEAVLAWMAVHSSHSALQLLGVATLGNTLGALTTWQLGRVSVHVKTFKRLHDRFTHPRAMAWVQRWGALALTLSWLPLLGDALCFAAGWLGVAFVPALLAITLGKLSRYAAILFVFS